jgi:Flp pilus assembly protein TadD
VPIDRAPHRPTPEEREAGAKLGFPADDDHARLTLSMVELGFAQKQYEECLALLKPLVRMRPDDARIYEIFGVLHQVLGESTEARLCFETAVELDDALALSHVNLGEIAWRRDKDGAVARRHLEAALKADASLEARARITLSQIGRG